MKMSYELLNEGRKLLGQPAEDFDEEKYRLVQQRLLTEIDIRIENQLVDFPLAFVAQLNLSDLALLPGFDPLLPRRGLLSFFVDVTWEDRQPFVFWHDVEVDTLSTLAVPDDLLAFTIRLNFVNHGNCVHRLSAWNLFPLSVFRQSARVKRYAAESV